MRRAALISILVLGGIAFFQGSLALGQTIYGPRLGGPVGNPGYSPYQNLFRGGPIYQNYYGLVRPELQFRGAIGALQQQVTLNQAGLADLAAGTGPLTTGHPSQFLNTSHYFLSSGGQLGAGAGQLGAGGGQLGNVGRNIANQGANAPRGATPPRGGIPGR
jgi:hypothetical protein